MNTRHLKQLSGWSCFPSPFVSPFNPNTIKSYKISQKLSPKHAVRGVAQSPCPFYRHGKACLSKQPPWRAAGDPHLAQGRSRFQAPAPAGGLRAFFSPPFLLREIVFSHLSHQTHKSVRDIVAKSITVTLLPIHTFHSNL